MLRSALFSTDEPFRISSLEVGDLKVDRLTVSQLEAYKVAASEIDAIVVSATEMTNKTEIEGHIPPSLLHELISIRNQLGISRDNSIEIFNFPIFCNRYNFYAETVAVAAQMQSRPQSAMEDASTATSNERIDLTPESERRSYEGKRSYTRESTPLLVVEPSISEQEATVAMGRTVFPHSSSATDLTSLSESDGTIIAHTEVKEYNKFVTSKTLNL